MAVNKFGQMNTGCKCSVLETTGVSVSYINNNFVRNRAITSLDMNNNKICNVLSPVNSQDVATKKYVDDSKDLSVGDLRLNVGEDTVRLLGCTDLTPGKGFILSLGELQNQIQYCVVTPSKLQTPITMHTTAGFLINANNDPVCQLGGHNHSDLIMNGNQIRMVRDPSNDQDAATKVYVDTAVNDRIHRAGDTMEGHLIMNNYRIGQLQNPAHDQDAATKVYVDSRKHLITIWASERGPINNDIYEWSFGESVSGESHRHIGYPMLASGRVIRMALTGTATRYTGEMSVNISVNGYENTEYGVTKPNNEYVGTTIFARPLELSQGDRINFRSASNTRSISAVVSLLIELDL